MTMTGKERMLTAMRRGIPDRVPASPDISNMVPARLTGKDFWEVYLFDNPSLGRAYMDAVRKFGIDAWYLYGKLPGARRDTAPLPASAYDLGGFLIHPDLVKRRRIENRPESIAEEVVIETPLGPLDSRTVYFRDNSPWPDVGWIKEPVADWPRLRWLMGDAWVFPDRLPDYDLVGEAGVYAISLDLPVDWWIRLRDRGDELALYDFFDRAELMDEIMAYYQEYSLARIRACIAARPDEVVFQGSRSSLSLISPKIYRRYNLPWIQALTRLTREAGLIAHQHTCGRSWALVEMNYAETQLDVMEPLEPPPGGDVDLAIAKKQFGDKFCLKGNLNTFVTMLSTPEVVEQAAIRCIDAAAEGGGYILATGDQCGRDTPDANLYKLVEVAETYGRYR